MEMRSGGNGLLVATPCSENGRQETPSPSTFLGNAGQKPFGLIPSETLPTAPTGNSAFAGSFLRIYMFHRVNSFMCYAVLPPGKCLYIDIHCVTLTETEKGRDEIEGDRERQRDNERAKKLSLGDR